MKKILIIGDLRTAGNFGAIATTESLLELVQLKTAEADEVRTIDSRSFSSVTPLEGWKVSVEEYLKQKQIAEKKWSRLKSLRYSGLVRIAVRLKHKVAAKGKQNKIKIPSLYAEYPEYAKEVKQKKLFEYEAKQIEWADIILFNSEGNIVNGTDAMGLYRTGGRYILFLEYLAKESFQKKCFVLNHTVDPKNRDAEEMIKMIYPKMDGVYVREQKSLKLLNEWGIKNAVYIPDALFSHDFESDGQVGIPDCLKNFDFTKPYICLGDSSGIENPYNRVKWDVVEVYSSLIDELKKRWPQIIFIDGNGGKQIHEVIKKNNLASVNVRNCSYHELYYVLKHSQIFISGRWHSSILSLMGHTPILLWGSDSHKTEALYSEIRYPFQFFDVNSLPLHIKNIADEAAKIMESDLEPVWDKVELIKAEAKKNVDML